MKGLLYIISIALLMLLSMFSDYAEAAPKRYARVTLRDQTTHVYELRKFDKKKLLFEFKRGGEKNKIKVNRVASLAFDTALTIADCNIDQGGGDHFHFRNGKDSILVLRKLDKKKVTYIHPGRHGLEASISLDVIAFICLNPGVLNVDRMEYGKGFNLLSPEEEVAMALAFAKDVESSTAMLNDSLVDSYIDSLGKHIAEYGRWPELDYTFRVVNSDAVNAYTTGGGQVFVNRGLLVVMGSEAELAGVLAHEIGHSVGRHISKTMSKKLLYSGIITAAGEVLNKDKNQWASTLTDVGGVLAFFSLQKYGRDEEREADMLGFYNLYEAGIHPGGMLTLFETLGKFSTPSQDILREWSATHPDPEERKSNVADELLYIDADDLIEDSDRFQWIREYVSALPPPQLSVTFWADTFAVDPGSSAFKEIRYDGQSFRNVRLTGVFRASGGSRNDIKFRVFDEMNFINWSNGNTAVPLLDSDRVTVYEVDYVFPEVGTYYIVFDNKYSVFTNKTVNCNLTLWYTER